MGRTECAIRLNIMELLHYLDFSSISILVFISAYFFSPATECLMWETTVLKYVVITICWQEFLERLVYRTDSAMIFMCMKG